MKLWDQVGCGIGSFFPDTFPRVCVVPKKKPMADATAVPSVPVTVLTVAPEKPPKHVKKHRRVLRLSRYIKRIQHTVDPQKVLRTQCVNMLHDFTTLVATHVALTAAMAARGNGGCTLTDEHIRIAILTMFPVHGARVWDACELAVSKITPYPDAP